MARFWRHEFRFMRMMSSAPSAETNIERPMMAGVFGITTDEMLEVPHALMGTLDEMAADIEARRERWGFSYHVVQQDAMETLAPVVARLAGT